MTGELMALLFFLLKNTKCPMSKVYKLIRLKINILFLWYSCNLSSVFAFYFALYIIYCILFPNFTVGNRVIMTNTYDK